MHSIKNLIVATAVSALLFVVHLGAARADDASVTLKPLQGISFHTGSLDAVAYFTADKGTCNIVVTVTDEFDYAPTRFVVAVKAGQKTRYEVTQGRSLEFACEAAGQAMTIKPLEALADEAPDFSSGAGWTRAGLGG